MSAWRKQAIKIIDDLILSNEIKSIFEVGCDDGGISRNLAKRYPDVKFYGVDFREDKILEANLLKNKSGLNKAIRFKVWFTNPKRTVSEYLWVVSESCSNRLTSVIIPAGVT